MSDDHQLIGKLIQLIHTSRIELSDEKVTQSRIAQIFEEAGIPFVKEYAFDKKDIVDFLVDGRIAVEIKIKGQKKAIYRQLERYAQHEVVTSIVLLTSVSMGLPETINNKNAYAGSLSRGWL
jgi:hypothetical protein